MYMQGMHASVYKVFHFQLLLDVVFYRWVPFIAFYSIVTIIALAGVVTKSSLYVDRHTIPGM